MTYEWEKFEALSHAQRIRALHETGMPPLSHRVRYAIHENAKAANDNFDPCLEVHHNMEFRGIVLLWDRCHQDIVLTKLSYTSILEE